MVAGDEHVIAALAVEAGPAFHRDRPSVELRLTREHQTTRQGRTELRRQRRHGLGAGEPTFRGWLTPGAVTRRGRSDRLVQLGRQPSQPVEIILQATFGVGVRVVKDPDRPAVTAGADLPQQGQIQMPRPQGLDLPSRGLAVGVHPVEVQAEQVGQQLRQELVEPLDDIMGVVQVIDDAHVAHPFGAQGLDHGDQVLRATEPTAMVIKGDLAALGRARLADRPESGDLGDDAGPLVGRILDGDRATLPHDPEPRADVMPAKERERGLGLVVQDRREPPPLEFDPVLLQGRQFGVPLRHMLGAVVVDETTEPQTREHLRPLLRPALLGVERHDAPRHQVVPLEQRLGRRQGQPSQKEDDERTHRGHP